MPSGSRELAGAAAAVAQAASRRKNGADRRSVARRAVWHMGRAGA
jgi:hypothetical protein